MCYRSTNWPHLALCLLCKSIFKTLTHSPSCFFCRLQCLDLNSAKCQLTCIYLNTMFPLTFWLISRLVFNFFETFLPKAVKRHYVPKISYRFVPVLKYTKCHISTNLSSFLKQYLSYCQKLFAFQKIADSPTKKKRLRGNAARMSANYIKRISSAHCIGWLLYLYDFRVYVTLTELDDL